MQKRVLVRRTYVFQCDAFNDFNKLYLRKDEKNMYDMNNYDNDIAYEYDDYVEEQIDDELEREGFYYETYMEKMIDQLIDELDKKNENCV